MLKQALSGVSLALFLMFWSQTASAAPEAALVMDARSGEVLYSSNADTKLHPASLTKMMTLYVVFEAVKRGEISLDTKVKISRNAASEPPSKLGLKAGQRMEVRYLIRAAAVKSANDAATALGEAVSGSEAAFTRRMTATAKALGMKNSTFKNAHGLTASGHLSTARDMATLGRRLFYDYPEYYHLFSRTTVNAGTRNVSNTNARLLSSYQGADGIKTGYTRAAGYNLVASAQKGRERVIAAYFGGKNTVHRTAQVAALLDRGFKKAPTNVRVKKPEPIRYKTVAALTESPAAASGSHVVRRASTKVVQTARPMPRLQSARMIAEAQSIRNVVMAAAEVQTEAVLLTKDEIAVIKSLADVVNPAPQIFASRPAARPATLKRAAKPVQVASLPTLSDAAPVGAAQAAAPVKVAAKTAAPETDTADWGIQLGAYRSRGSAEKLLLKTALQDLEALEGAYRKVVPASVKGVTMYRARFVGLSKDEAIRACARLKARKSECQPMAPGS